MEKRDERLSKADAFDLLIDFMSSGRMGPTRGKVITSMLLKATYHRFSWLAALVNIDEGEVPVVRYRIDIDRHTRGLSRPVLVDLSETELRQAILDATGRQMSSFCRLQDGAFSVSYKVTVDESPRKEYVVQLRHHGNAHSMNLLMMLISSTVDPRILPLPRVYPIPGEDFQQCVTGRGRQITEFVYGHMATTVYHSFSYHEKMVFVQDLARAFEAIWDIPMPGKRFIGELRACRQEDKIVLFVGSHRAFIFRKRHETVREYLKSYIRNKLDKLQDEEDIEEYKAVFLERIEKFVETSLDDIPAVVEEIPVVVMHNDLGLHNIIVSAEDPTRIKAIIDWEITSCSPYACQHLCIERLFRKPSWNLLGEEYPYANDLREAFWGAIPRWRAWNESEASKVFKEWFLFGLFLKPVPGQNVPLEVRHRGWSENMRIVNEMLAKYGSAP